MARLISILACFTLFAAAATAAPIVLPADPPAQRTVDLEEVWRIGGEDDEDILLGVTQRGVMDSQGNVFLLDSQLSQVLVISPDGELVTTLGREGEGPGEMNRPADLFLMDDTQVGISQGFPAKVVTLNLDGTPGDAIEIGTPSDNGGFFFMGEAYRRGGHLVLMHGRGSFNMETGKSNTTTSLSLLEADGSAKVTFAEHKQERDLQRQVYDEEKNFSELDQWTLGNNQVFTVPVRDQYLINVRDMDGTLTHTLQRDFAPRKRSQDDKDGITSGMVMIINGVRQEIENHVLDHDPAIMGLRVAADGHLFVVNCYQQTEKLTDGAAGRYDVISPEGQFIEELTLRAPDMNPEEDRLIFLDGKSFLLIRNLDSAQSSMRAGFGGGGEEEEDLGDVEPLEVVLYRMP